MRAIDVRVTGGLSALVLADRGLDIGPAWVAGQPLAGRARPASSGPPTSTRPTWLRSFHGGLLVTCGLQNVGPACVDEGVPHGVHGRASHIPARNVTHRVVEDGDRLVAEVSGEVRETDVYGVDLRAPPDAPLPDGRAVRRAPRRGA